MSGNLAHRQELSPQGIGIDGLIAARIHPSRQYINLNTRPTSPIFDR